MCGKHGHKTNRCGLKSKTYELFGSDEELKNMLLALLLQDE